MGLGSGIRKKPNPDPGSGSATLEKYKEFSCFEVLDFLYRGLKASPVACASFMEAQEKVNCNFRCKKYKKVLLL
jgi:hypothetical protein